MDLSANDPELDGKFLGTITADFVKVADGLKEASYLVRSRQISKHPIFVLCKEAQPIGALLYDKNEEALDWHYFMSMSEEFLQRGLLGPDGIEAFAATFKDPDEFCCLFVVSPELTSFVFIPYPED